MTTVLVGKAAWPGAAVTLRLASDVLDVCHFLESVKFASEQDDPRFQGVLIGSEL